MLRLETSAAHRLKQFRFIYAEGDETENCSEENENGENRVQCDGRGESGAFHYKGELPSDQVDHERVKGKPDRRNKIHDIEAEKRADPGDLDWRNHFGEPEAIWSLEWNFSSSKLQFGSN